MFRVREIKQPSFKGKHNELRSKALLVLMNYRLEHKYGKGLTAHELSELTGCNYRSILSSMGKWCKWRYIIRVQPSNGIYRYRPAKRGSKWLDRHIKALRLPLSRYLDEMERAQRQLEKLCR